MGRIRKMLAVLLTLAMIVTIVPAVKRAESVGAAQNFAIVSPKDNGLMAAGHFDIEWSQAANGTVKEYKVFIDDKEVATTTELSYDYYTTDVKMYSAYVTAEYTDGTMETTQEVTFGVTKKGLAVNGDMGKNLNPVAMNMGWYYTWGTSGFSNYLYRNLEFVPMIWGAGNETNAINSIKGDYTYLLAYNEPDMGWQNGGSNMDVSVAINNWPKFVGGDYYLGSPAPAYSPSWGNGTWFRTFMDSVDTSTIDFIPLHCYYGQYGGAAGANSFLTEVVDKTYEMYHKPIWITEFAVSGWGYSNVAARKSLNEFMYTVIDGLNSREYVERYSWFSFDTTDENNGASALWTNSTGLLTELGNIYADYGNPEGYVAPETEEPSYKVTSARRTTAYEESITINGVTCDNYIKSSDADVSVTASSELGANSVGQAIDGNVSTRWESVQGVDPQTFTIDLDTVRKVKQINILWENASARDYSIEVSTDGVNYTQAAEAFGMNEMQNRNDTILLNNMVSARYIKITGTARTTDYGYSIYEVGVFGTEDTKVDDTEQVETTTRQNISQRPETTTEPPKNTTKESEESLTTAKVKVGTTKVKKASKKKISANIKISLKKIKGVKGYQIRIYQSKKAKKILVKKSVKKIQFTLKNKKLKNKKTLYVSARAYKVSKGTKYYGKWSVRKKVSIKK